MKAGLLWLLFAMLVPALWLVRLLMLQQLSFDLFGCRVCVIPHVIQADALYWAAVLTMLTLSLLRDSWLWRLSCRSIALLGVWLYAADLMVMHQFGTRLMLPDVKVYLADTRLVFDMLLEWPLWQVLAAMGALLLSLVFWVLPSAKPLPRKSAAALMASLITLGGLTHMLITPSGYVHEWAVRNILNANLPSGIATVYSRESIGRLEASQPVSECVDGRDRRDNILVLILESWSTYHSHRWLGSNDWTPRLDALAGQGLWFNELHAGGFTTNEGLVSLLTGRDIVRPTLPAYQMNAFEGAWNVKGALPSRLSALGYRTAFLTSGNLTYTRKGEWLRYIGFDTTQGHDTSAYDGLPRGHFEAVADEVLYRHALTYLREQREVPRPGFWVIENVSSHHPYVHPITQERSEEAVFRYMDATAASFIEQLVADGFLDDGVIFVISDHRAMTFVTPAEQQYFGRSAVSRIPGFVLARNTLPSQVNRSMHQADLLPTIMRHISREYCMPAARRDLLAPQDTESRCLLHARGDRRDHIDVFCPDGEGTVQLDGDNSHFINQIGLGHAEQQSVLDTIARQRLGMLPPTLLPHQSLTGRQPIFQVVGPSYDEP